jgi:WD40 repeat protein
MPITPALISPDADRQQMLGTRPALSLAATANGSWIITGFYGGRIRVRNMALAPGARSTDIESEGGSVFCLAAIEHATRVLAGGQDGDLRIWNLTTGAQEKQIPGHIGPIRSIAVTSDESVAMTGGDDKKLRVWSLRTFGSMAARNAESPVRSMAVTGPSTAVTGGEDGIVRVWNLATRRCDLAVDGHTGPVLCVASIANGNGAVTGGEDGTVRMRIEFTCETKPPLTHGGPDSCVPRHLR